MHTSASKRRFALVTACAVALAGWSLVSRADNIKVYLSGKDEVPPVTTAASGQGTLSVSNRSISGTVATEGVAATMAHIHSGKKGENGPVLIKLEKSGNNRWVVPAGTTLTDEANKALEAGNLYVNVHSEANPAGEIRGQVEMPVWMKDQPKGRSSAGGGY